MISVSKFEIPDASVGNFMQAVKNFMQAVKTLCKQSKTLYLPKLRTSGTGRENFTQVVLKSKFYGTILASPICMNVTYTTICGLKP